MLRIDGIVREPPWQSTPAKPDQFKDRYEDRPPWRPPVGGHRKSEKAWTEDAPPIQGGASRASGYRAGWYVRLQYAPPRQKGRTKSRFARKDFPRQRRLPVSVTLPRPRLDRCFSGRPPAGSHFPVHIAGSRSGELAPDASQARPTRRLCSRHGRTARKGRRCRRRWPPSLPVGGQEVSSRNPCDRPRQQGPAPIGEIAPATLGAGHRRRRRQGRHHLAPGRDGYGATVPKHAQDLWKLVADLADSRRFQCITEMTHESAGVKRRQRASKRNAFSPSYGGAAGDAQQNCSHPSVWNASRVRFIQPHSPAATCPSLKHQPPSTASTWPVTNRAASDSRKTAAPSQSSGRPIRPPSSGCFE